MASKAQITRRFEKPAKLFYSYVKSQEFASALSLSFKFENFMAGGYWYRLHHVYQNGFEGESITITISELASSLTEIEIVSQCIMDVENDNGVNSKIVLAIFNQIQNYIESLDNQPEAPAPEAAPEAAPTPEKKKLPKAALIGMSYGGLFSLRWAAEHPETVGAMYLDAPVCDLAFAAKQKEGNQRYLHFAEEAAKHFVAYNAPDAEALEKHPLSPLNNYQKIAEAGIPILAIRSGQDLSVIPESNIDILEERIKNAGGNIQIIRRDLYGHHPHGLDDPTPLTGFILQHYPDFEI